MPYWLKKVTSSAIWNNALFFLFLLFSFSFQLPNLLAEFGGVLGLWVGISIITLMEFFEIIAFSVCFLKDTWTEKSRALRLTIRQKHEQYRQSRKRTRTAKRRRLQTDFKSESTNAITTIINSYVQ